MNDLIKKIMKVLLIIIAATILITVLRLTTDIWPDLVFIMVILLGIGYYYGMRIILKQLYEINQDLKKARWFFEIILVLFSLIVIIQMTRLLQLV